MPIRNKGRRETMTNYEYIRALPQDALVKVLSELMDCTDFEDINYFLNLDCTDDKAGLCNVDTVLKGLKACYPHTEEGCEDCPYKSESKCRRHLLQDAIIVIEQLRNKQGKL